MHPIFVSLLDRLKSARPDHSDWNRLRDLYLPLTLGGLGRVPGLGGEAEDLTRRKDRVTACQVIRQGDGYLTFYIGFRDRDHAQIGLARSKDGIIAWERHPANPVIRPGNEKWDHDAVYRPYAIFDGRRWLLWYNGRRGGAEQIGLATHEGEDLGF